MIHTAHLIGLIGLVSSEISGHDDFIVFVLTRNMNDLYPNSYAVELNK